MRTGVEMTGSSHADYCGKMPVNARQYWCCSKSGQVIRSR